MWRFLHNEIDIVGAIHDYEPKIASFVTVSFIVTTQFIFFNMIRAFISHAYFEIALRQNVKLSLEEELKVEHWLVKLESYKDPLIDKYNEWVAKRNEGKDGKPIEKFENKPDAVKSILTKNEK